MVKVFCNTKLKLLEVKPQIRSPKSKEIIKLNVAVGFLGLLAMNGSQHDSFAYAKSLVCQALLRYFNAILANIHLHREKKNGLTAVAQIFKQ